MHNLGWQDGSVGVIAIPQARANGKARTSGFIQALDQAGIKGAGILQQVNFSYQETYDYSRELIRKNPSLRANWLQGSDRYQAALDAIHDAGKQGEILLLTFDAEPEFLQMIPQQRLVGAAMYHAKSLGRNNFQYYSKEMTDQAFERLNMEANIHSGIQNKEFVVYFQPQMNHDSGKLIGMEALVRWNNPHLGFIPPDRFIPVAAATGSIVELDRYVMKKATARFAEWIQQGLNPGRLSMNLNMKQLHRDDFIDFLKQLIADSGVAASRIELEVTEGELMDNPECSIKMLQQIADLGITLSLDDFGTGYSSLSYLKRMPISKLKIDQSFIRDFPDDKEDEAIVKAIIALATSLNLDLLAEGTETEQQVKQLNRLGCGNFQGYFFSKPVPSEQMQQYLEKLIAEKLA